MKKIFALIFKLSKDTGLQWFQYRITHRILGTNSLLNKMGKSPTENCSFCKIEKESIRHLFWDCDITNYFWRELQRRINQKCGHASNLKLTQLFVLFGVETNINSDGVLDFIVLHAKSFLFYCKRTNKNPRLIDFICSLKERYSIERYNATLTFTRNTFDARWAYYQNFLEIEG